MAFRKVLRQVYTETRRGSQDKLKIKNFFVLVDGYPIKYLPGGLKNQKAIIKGDQKSISIAAASIIAKVYRDSFMMEFHKKYPQYGIANHKGYGTKEHRENLRIYGLSKIHRTSFNLSKYS